MAIKQGGAGGGGANVPSGTPDRRGMDPRYDSGRTYTPPGANTPGSGINWDNHTQRYTAYVDGELWTYGPNGWEPTDSGSSGSSSGGGWSGGRGGGGSDPTSQYRNQLEYWYGPGNVPADVLSLAVAEEWGEVKMKNYALMHGAQGERARDAIQEVRNALDGYVSPEQQAAIPDSLLRAFAAEGLTAEEIVQQVMELPGGDILATPAAQAMIDEWIEQTGIALTYTARLKLREIISRHGGANAMAMAEWTAWVKTTDSAKNGNYGAEQRFNINTIFYDILEREATPEEIEQLWDANAYQLLEHMRSTEEYAEIYKFKPVGMPEDDYKALEKSWELAYFEAFGIDIGQLGLDAVDQYTEEQVAIEPTSPPEWKSLTMDTFRSDLKQYGIEYVDGKYMREDQEVAFEDLKNYLPTDIYYYDESGYHYVQIEGALDKNGNPAAVTVPREIEYETVRKPVDWKPDIPDAFMDTMINSGIDPAYWLKSIGWGEDATVLQAQYGAALEQTGVSFDERDWYVLASGAIGSGALRAQIIEAQNKVAFREVFRDYNGGQDPTAADYEYLSTNFVSPTEYAHRTAAVEYAKQNIDSINEVLNRTLGLSVSESDLENLAMGGKGSGALKAKIDQATRLDAFTWEYEKRTGDVPTPAQYKEFLGYTGPEELVWNMDLAEEMAELGPDIKEVWEQFYKEPLSDESLHIMLGDMVGSGDLKYKLKEAREWAKEEETREYYRWNEERANTPIARAEAGGFKLSVPGIGAI